MFPEGEFQANRALKYWLKADSVQNSPLVCGKAADLCVRYPARIYSLLPNPDLSSVSVSQRQKLRSRFKSIYLWIRPGVEISMRVGEKNLRLLQQLSLQHQPQVGSDWLERRLDVITLDRTRSTEWGSAQGSRHVEHTGMFTVPANVCAVCRHWQLAAHPARPVLMRLFYFSRFILFYSVSTFPRRTINQSWTGLLHLCMFIYNW